MDDDDYGGLSVDHKPLVFEVFSLVADPMALGNLAGFIMREVVERQQ